MGFHLSNPMFVKFKREGFEAWLAHHNLSRSDAEKRGQFTDEWFEADETEFRALANTTKKSRDAMQTAKPHPPEPSAAELAGNFAGALTRWAVEGFQIVLREQYDARAAVCNSCELWDGSARMGLGICKSPKCGCTSFKRWLSTERCPLAKWPA